MLREQKRATLEHENALTATRTPEEEVLRQRSAERPAADDDDVKRAHVTAGWQLRLRAIAGVGVGQRLVKGVADVAAEYIECEIGWLRTRANVHLLSLRSVRLLRTKRRPALFSSVAAGHYGRP